VPKNVGVAGQIQEVQAGGVGARVASCPACGYDLRGAPSARCPECGADVAAVAERERRRRERRRRRRDAAAEGCLGWALLEVLTWCGALLFALVGC